jgi:hypothetical protein
MALVPFYSVMWSEIHGVDPMKACVAGIKGADRWRASFDTFTSNINTQRSIDSTTAHAANSQPVTSSKWGVD